MNRTLLLLIAVAVLGTGAYFLLGEEKGGPVTSVVGADRDFAVDQEQVYKIFLADRHGNKTTLTREAGGWMYNEKYRAREDAMDALLTAIDKIRMRFMPTKAAVPHMVETLATSGIKVEIYGKEDQLLKAYYLGGATNDEYGTYIILEGAEQPYVADIPGWEGNIRFRYNLIGDDWRDRAVFRSQPEDIASVSVEYPKQQNKSFLLQVEGEEKLAPFYPLSPKIQRPLRAGRIDAYKGNFEEIIASGFKNYHKDKASIIQQVPFAIIELTKKDGSKQSVKLFPDFNEAAIDPKTGIAVQPNEVTDFYGLTQDGDFVMLQDVQLNKILWAYDFFYQ